MPISKPHSTLGASNLGSCSLLATYLDKENRELDTLINKNNSISEIEVFQKMKQGFFNHSESKISPIEVINAIDTNIKKLGKKDDKYFAPTISFSSKELQHIIFFATGREDIEDVWKLTPTEIVKYNDYLKAYTKKVMDNYALNFNRENKGLKSGYDLVYYAKIEHFRKYKGMDKEVIDGLARNGDYKPGLNSHAHIVVSRKDKTQRLKLKPIVNDRSTQRTIGGNTYQVGFDRMKWINKNEQVFDELFNYNRAPEEKFENQYILKKGSPKDKDAVQRKIEEHKLNLKNKIQFKNNSRVM